jgi:DNA-binding transcriptional MerR regulator
MSKYINISELSIILGLIDKSNYKPLNHILRYWEKEFRQIKPKKINKRRYYSEKQVETVKMIKFLIKTKGMSIRGVKNILNTGINKLDGNDLDGLKAGYYKLNFKNKSKKILDKINKLKQYGKKNTLKS